MRSWKRGSFGAVMLPANINCSVENKSIRLAYDRFFDLSIQKIRHNTTIIIIKPFGNSLELLTFISCT